MPPPDARPPITALRLILTGRVQGVGVRPALARLASALNLAGTIANCRSGVEVCIEGSADCVRRFEEQIQAALPEESHLAGIERDPVPERGLSGFQIEEQANITNSSADSTSAVNFGAVVSAEVPRDSAICGACLSEAATVGDRRHHHPFTGCTRCGPRYSIIERMPYERSQSSMRMFSLCLRCRGEFTDGNDRRFHAQTICCPDCGPRVWCIDGQGHLLGQREAALQLAVAAIRAGGIVAIRGLGGYQLVCDATDAAVVRKLRDRKQRPSKPLAVMVETLAAMEAIADLNAEERRAATSAANPIVIVKARPNSPVAVAVHPGLTEIGVMLPTTALHWRLASELRRPLVVTSGNVEGDPLATDPAEAERDLAGVADLWLHHDRPIRRPIDDSVIRVIAGRPVTLRAGRGVAPLRLPMDAPMPLLAAGGQQKGAVALSNGRQSILGPHVGDLDNPRTQARFCEHVRDLVDLYGEPCRGIVHDLHPGYFTTRWAQSRVEGQSFRRLDTQHHHAHVAAGMIEPGWLDREVIGAAFDGTGFGPDGTVWGGEFLLATAAGYRRVARLRPFPLPGSEAAIREPWRVGVALVAEATGTGVAARQHWPGIDADSIAAVLKIRGIPRFSPRTSSVGRLFDGVAALILGVRHAAYEGQAAMLLESVSDPAADGQYAWKHSAELEELDWRPMILELLRDRAAGATPGVMAQRFHRGLATATAAVLRRFAPRPIVLGGGAFQNRLLTELLAECLRGGTQPLGLPGSIPPNDGGLAAGQLAIAVARLTLKGDH